MAYEDAATIQPLDARTYVSAATASAQEPNAELADKLFHLALRVDPVWWETE